MLSPQRSARYSQVLELLAHKLVRAEAQIGIEFPYMTNDRGRWLTMPASLSAGYQGDKWSHGNWFGGFWIGLLLAAHIDSGDDRFLRWATERMKLIAPRCDDGNTHDIGFIFQSSAIPLYHVTGHAHYRDIAVRAAQRLRARLITTRGGAYLSSWGPLTDRRGRRSSAIDTMANLALLYWAAQETDDGSFRWAAQAHADTTAAAMIREDDSTYHAVEYDLISGERARGFTFQGFSDESCWPRGQAWAMCGYGLSARASGKQNYWDTAQRLSAYFVRRTGDGRIPPWDFDAPDTPDRPQDSSAAAIAAAAMIDMSEIEPGSEIGRRWLETALLTLDQLCASYVSWDSHRQGLLEHGVYSMPHRTGTDCSVMFGDYYFVYSLMKVLHPGKFWPELDSSVAPRTHTGQTRQ